MTCALKKFLEMFSESDLRRLGCIFHLYDYGVREFTSVSLWSALHLLCGCDGLQSTIQRFLRRLRENGIMNMKRITMSKMRVYELNMENELVAELFSKYHAVMRGEIYVNDDVDDEDMVCKYELLVLEHYWDLDIPDMIPDRRVMEILKKV